jgi:serine/threonine protein kinase
MASGIDDTRLGPVGPATTSAASSRAVSRGRYRLGVLLGQGGMATVVEAEDVSLNRTVAI